MEGLERFAAALPPTEFEAPCDCDYCMLQYAGHNASADLVLSYAGHLSNEAAAKRAGEYTESIQKNRQHIICMINNHGNAILKKWRRDQQYRRKTLLKVDPSIYPTRNPMLSMLGTPGSTSSEDLTNSRRAFLLPYINLEDLIGDGSNLIKLLHKRSEFPLEQWVPFDNAQLKPAWKQALLRVSSAYGCIVMHGPEFGRWKAFDEDEVHRGDAYGTPRGLLILQAQKALFSFLRATIDEISGGSVAHDVQSRLVTAPLLPIAAPTAAYDKWLPFLNALSSREGPRSSFGSAFAEQPFSSPPVFDVDTLLDISENRAAQAQDELWLLQTDLEYFVGVAGYFQSQWYDRVPGVTDIHDLDEEEKYDNVGHTITEKVLIRATNWQWLRELCQSVQREFRISMTDIHAGEELPEIYETELGFLFTVVKNCLFQEQTDLQRLTLKSREFQHNFRVKRTIDTSHGWGWGLEYEFNNYKDSYRAERIGWCFYHLVQDSECSTSFENALVLQHLDNHLNSQPKEEAERLDQEIYRCLSDIAALERMAELLEYHRPIFVLPDPEELRQDPRQIFQIKGKLQQASDSTNHLRGLGQALKPLCGFSLPEKRDMKWLAQRDLGCQKLSNFWMVARNTYQARLQAVSIPQALIDPQLALMEACDSPENIARLTSVKKEIIDQVRASEALRTAEIAMTIKERAGLLPENPKDKKRASVIAKSKRQSLVGTDAEQSYAVSWSPILYRLPETSIAWQVVKRMFPDRSAGAEDGSRTTTTWKELVTAMGALGFAAEPNGGSMYRFGGDIMVPVPNANPKRQKRKLGVHRLHASGDMQPNFLQALGRRCNKNFGWERDLFVTTEDMT